MSDPTFTQAESRRATPLFVAAGVLAAVAVLVFYLNPHDTAAVTLANTHAIPTRTNFKNDSIVIGAPQAGQDDLYVLTTIRIEDHLRLPITIDTMVATLVTADGQQSTTSAATKEDLPAIFGAFPQLKPLSASPLLRETAIEPKQSAEGQVIFHFPVTKAVWDARQSATVEVDLYHQIPQTIVIPK